MPVTRAKGFNALIQIESVEKALPKGGNSNTGNLATIVFQNSALSVTIFQIPKTLLLSLWELSNAVRSSVFKISTSTSRMQGDLETSFCLPVITINRRISFFDFRRQAFSKNMTANVHLLIAHGDLYLRRVGSNFQC